MARAATQHAARAPNITQQPDPLFDGVGVGALALNFARALAEPAGVNGANASVRFYSWRAARLAQEQ